MGESKSPTGTPWGSYGIHPKDPRAPPRDPKFPPRIPGSPQGSLDVSMKHWQSFGKASAKLRPSVLMKSILPSSEQLGRYRLPGTPLGPPGVTHGKA